MESKSAKAKRRSVWCERDAQVLLELWAERATDLRRAKRNGHIYQDIAAQMNYKYTPQEVHVKIRNFSQKYREEKKEMGPSGGSPSKWRFYNAVHQIIGSNAANSAEVVESALFENTSEIENINPLSSPLSQPSPVSLPFSSPALLSSPSPLSPLGTSTSAAAVSSGRKRNILGEAIKMMKEQNVMLRSVVQDSQSLSNQIVDAIREQNETSKEFLGLMKNLIDKI